ncbi:MAG: hypothetical protein NC434_06860 [Ruminococcus sp.]|nr:hypothetical protein [Ruminococcus sp.]
MAVTNIRTLSYQSIGWGVVLVEYKFDFADDLVEVNYYDYDETLHTHREDTFSPEQQKKLRLACAFSLMPVWKWSYHNPAVSDGDQWEVMITYNNGKEKRTYGSNAYPLLYPLAHDTITSISDTLRQTEIEQDAIP